MGWQWVSVFPLLVFLFLKKTNKQQKQQFIKYCPIKNTYKSKYTIYLKKKKVTEASVKRWRLEFMTTLAPCHVLAPKIFRKVFAYQWEEKGTFQLHVYRYDPKRIKLYFIWERLNCFLRGLCSPVSPCYPIGMNQLCSFQDTSRTKPITSASLRAKVSSLPNRTRKSSEQVTVDPSLVS